MGRRRRSTPATEWRVGSTPTPVPASVAVEEPLEIRVAGEALAVTLRTPGDDFDLVSGFLFSEGHLAGPDDVVSLRYCAGRGPDGEQRFNVVDATLADGRTIPAGSARTTTVTGACGICGRTSLDQVAQQLRWRPAEDPLIVPAGVVRNAVESLPQHQPLFARTGGVHGAGLFSSAGEVIAVREDIGRHNAVDKVIGWALRSGRLPLRRHLLVLSGRAGFELVQKAALAGVPAVVSVSAPTSLAVDLARESSMLLAAFARDGRFTVYAGAERLG